MLVGSKYILPRHDDAAQQSNTEIGRYFDVHFQYKMMFESTYWTAHSITNPQKKIVFLQAEKRKVMEISVFDLNSRPPPQFWDWENEASNNWRGETK